MVPPSITASGRHPEDSTGFFVFNNATIYSAGALPGTAYLGRPWREGSKVAFQNSYLSDVINPDGWLAWNPTDLRTARVQFQEYGNSGPGAQGKRLYETPLRSPYLPQNILGPDYLNWVDYSYRPIVTSKPNNGLDNKKKLPNPIPTIKTSSTSNDPTGSSPNTNLLGSYKNSDLFPSRKQAQL